MIHFACPNCGKTFQVKDELAGRQAKCPKCRQVMQVPVREPAAITSDTSDSFDASTPLPEITHMGNRRESTSTGKKNIKQIKRTKSRAGVWVALAGGGFVLILATILATVGVTLWATGSFSRGRTAQTHEASEKQDNAGAVHLAELNRADAEKLAQVQKEAEEAAKAEQHLREAEEDRKRSEERERVAERNRSLKADFNEAIEERDSLNKKHDSLVAKKDAALKSAALWTQRAVDSVKAGFSKDIVDGNEQNMKESQAEAKRYASQLEDVKDSIERLDRKIKRIERELGAAKE